MKEKEIIRVIANTDTFKAIAIKPTEKEKELERLADKERPNSTASFVKKEQDGRVWHFMKKPL
jgi:hypothetical protein